jgi:GNAT superfamily N-acetyltransferase
MPTAIATIDQAKAVATLVTLAYRVEDFLVDGDRTNPDDVREKMSHGAFLTIAEANGALVGAVYVELREGGARCYFGMLSVHPERQGQGLARRLVSAVEDYARAAGCTHVDLHVLSPRLELPAFYRHLGYADNGTLPFDEPTKLPCHIQVRSKSGWPNPATGHARRDTAPAGTAIRTRVSRGHGCGHTPSVGDIRLRMNGAE